MKTCKNCKYFNNKKYCRMGYKMSNKNRKCFTELTKKETALVYRELCDEDYILWGELELLWNGIY